MPQWRIVASPADLDRLRYSEAFAELLTLGRVANLLRASLLAAVHHGSQGGTSADRDRMAMTLLLTGLITEALPVLERSGKHFRHLPAFTNDVQQILSDDKLPDFRQKWCAPLRNQAVFHNDAEVSREGLVLLAPGVPQELAHGSSLSFVDTHYPTADVVAFLYIIQSAGARDGRAPQCGASESVRLGW